MKDKLVRLQANRIALILLVLISLALLSSNRTEKKLQEEDIVRIMFYNVENLFDTIDSKLNDNEFLPDSDRHWNGFKYKQKLNNIAKVIVSAGTWDPPDIIGLCEVENYSVVDDLISKTILKNIGYKAIYSKTEDTRGIGIALIYSPDFELLSNEVVYPISELGDTLATRTVLYARLTDGIDTLGCIVSHWPSRRGGVAASDWKRELMANITYDRFIKNTRDGEKDLKMIMMGDMNCEPGSKILNVLTNPDRGSSDQIFFNVSDSRNSTCSGSYKFQGRWMLYDQILVSTKLRNSGKGLSYREGSFKIIGNDFQLVQDNTFRGRKPFSTWRGPVFSGGYSDHLPVVIDLIR